MPESLLELNDRSEAERLASEEEQAMQANLRAALEGVETRAIQRFNDQLVEITKPDTSRRPEIVTTIERAGRPSYSSAGPIMDLRDERYLGLPEHYRKLRNPKTDELALGWIRAMTSNHPDQMEKFERRLLDCYRLEDGFRASVLQGTTTAVSGLSTGTGGALIPLPLSNMLILARNLRARFRPRCTIFTSDALTLRVPTSPTASAAGTYSEGAGPAQIEPAFGSVLLSKKKLGGAFIVSIEMLEDSPFNVVSIFTERAGSAIGEAEDVQVATSNGTAPNFTSSIESVTLTQVGNSPSIVYGDMISLWYGLPDPEQDDATWMASGAQLQNLSKLLDANGRPIFEMANAPGTVVGDNSGMRGAMFGRPVIRSPFAEARIRVGNLQKYAILDGGGIRVRASEHVSFATDLVRYHIFERADGAVLETGAFRENTTLITGP